MSSLKPLIAKLNPATKRALEHAAALCVRNTNYSVDIEHLLVELAGIPDSDFTRILTHFAIDPLRVIHNLNQALDRLKRGNAGTPYLAVWLEKALKERWLFASLDCNANAIRSGHILAAMVIDLELAKYLTEISPEFGLILAKEMHSNFAQIVAGSMEDTP